MKPRHWRQVAETSNALKLNKSLPLIPCLPPSRISEKRNTARLLLIFSAPNLFCIYPSCGTFGARDRRERLFLDARSRKRFKL